MNTVIKFSNAVIIGLHAMAYLADNPDTFCTIKDIAKKVSVSKNHLAKVALQLSKSGLIETATGPTGGLKLARSADKITLLEIYKAIEGEFVQGKCMFGKKACKNRVCYFPGFYENVLSGAFDYLRNTRLSDVNER
jgi:Rrf2 family protein